MPSSLPRWAVGLIVIAAAGVAAALALRSGLGDPPVRRVIVIGLDAADWQLLDP